MNLHFCSGLALLSTSILSFTVAAADAPAVGMADIVRSAAQQVGVDENLAIAIALAESNLRFDVVSRTGAVGLMQVLPSTRDALVNQGRISNGDLYDPHYNALAGCVFIRRVLEVLSEAQLAEAVVRLGLPDRTAAVAAGYSHGPSALKQVHPDDFPAEVHRYAFRVSHHYKRLKSLPHEIAESPQVGVSGRGVRCRREPSIDSASVVQLSRGDRVALLGYRGIWARIESPQGICHIYDPYADPPRYPYLIMAADGVLRDATSSDINGALRRGMRLIIKASTKEGYTVLLPLSEDGLAATLPREAGAPPMETQ